MGGLEDYFGPGIFFLCAPEHGFLFFAWYGPGCFGQDHAYKNKQKSFIYVLILT